MTKISPILIDAKNRTVSRIPAFEESLQKIYSLIGCELITSVGLDNGDCLFLDDEGLINGTEEFFYLEGMGQPFAGNALVMGGADDEGNSTDPKSTVEGIAEKVQFMNADAFKQGYLDELVTPHILSFESSEEMMKFIMVGKKGDEQ